ncbi:hypothetical protein SAMN05216227_100473 [Pseudorhodobacter antarcticus]|jgi:hypothetical protein|uniref:Regulatory protein SoxS n=1 Tax=Pseudorhodobacter antarcticus TaxID=1077947 RepID=A0A1H8C7Z7_9RHOB|nr:hypothetical protein [Pseudorhodobacter antarcticus]SEM90388.1 hypothetical protein SAMN05216227_100473 [Pseudorhodobacter antarcticus]
MLRSRRTLISHIAAIALAGSAGLASAQELTLFMVEQKGCIYCERWHAEVGDAYPKTSEGRAAPLRPIDLRADPPEGVTFARRAVFTPTFILVRDGAEIARLEGYPGEDFFWPLLAEMLTDAGAVLEPGG